MVCNDAMMFSTFSTIFMVCVATFAQRPEEIVRAGRTADDHQPVISFKDVAQWRVETDHAVAKAEYATDRVLFGDGTCKITYRGTDGDKHPTAKFFFPQPVAVPADAVRRKTAAGL